MRYLALLLVLHSSFSVADAYRCVENGKVFISNHPCAASRVVRSETISPNAALEAHQENARQRAYLDQREQQKRNDQIAVHRHMNEVDRMYPNRPEPVPPSSAGVTFRSCGLGGSCPTTRTVTR